MIRDHRTLGKEEAQSLLMRFLSMTVGEAADLPKLTCHSGLTNRTLPRAAAAQIITQVGGLIYHLPYESMATAGFMVLNLSHQLSVISEPTADAQKQSGSW